MADTSRPFAETKFLKIKGCRMACIDEGDSPAIVFLHGSKRHLRRAFYPQLTLKARCYFDEPGLGDLPRDLRHELVQAVREVDHGNPQPRGGA